MQRVDQHIELCGKPHFFPALEARIRAWYEAPAGEILVLNAAPGSGKTQLIGRALQKEEVIRIVCFPGMFAGELLEELGLALIGLGDPRLYQCLSQGAVFTLQLDTLKAVLSEHKPCLWLDDADRLEATPFEQFEAPHGEVSRLLEAIVGAAGDGVRLIMALDNTGFVQEMLSDKPCRTLSPGRLSPAEATVYWQSLTDPAQQDLDHVENSPTGPLPWPEEWQKDSPLPLPWGAPLMLRLAGAGKGEPAGEHPPATSSTQLFESAWAALPQGARWLLMGCVETGCPIMRGMLRFVERQMGYDRAWFQQLLDAGWMTGAGRESNRFFVNPEVAAMVAGQIPGDASCVKPYKDLLDTLADYWAETGTKNARLWDLLRAVRLYTRARSVDSLYKLLRNVLERLLRWGYLDLGEALLRRLLDWVDGNRRAVVLGNLAIVKKNQGAYDIAMQHYEEARAIFEDLQDQANMARVLHQLGNISYIKGDMELAVRYYDQSRQTAELCNDMTVAAAAQIQVANVSFVQGEYEDAQYAYQQGLAMAEALEDKPMILAVLLQLGQIAFARKDVHDAQQVFQRSAGMAEAMGDHGSRAKALQFLGLIAQGRSDYGEAVKYFSETRDLSRRLQDYALQGAAAFYLGHVQSAQGDLAQALKNLMESLSLMVATSQDNEQVQRVVAVIRGLAAQADEARLKQLAEEAQVDWAVLFQLMRPEDGSGSQ